MPDSARRNKTCPRPFYASSPPHPPPSPSVFFSSPLSEHRAPSLVSRTDENEIGKLVAAFYFEFEVTSSKTIENHRKLSLFFLFLPLSLSRARDKKKIVERDWENDCQGFVRQTVGRGRRKQRFSEAVAP